MTANGKTMARSLCALIILPAAYTVNAIPPPDIIVNDQAVKITNNEVRLHTPVNNVQIGVGVLTNEAAFQPSDLNRIKFKLEGLDTAWVQNDQTSMGLILFFYDSTGDLVGQKYFSNTGDSPGWRGSITRSQFNHRHETITIPDRAGRASLTITSAGPPHAIGTYAVRHLTPLHKNNWLRGGLRPSMAKMINDGKDYILYIEDDSPDAHAEWHLANTKVTPGGTLTLEWDELYSIGSANRVGKDYKNIPVGKHRLLISEQDALDNSKERLTAITLIVTQPYWQQPWFWFLPIGSLLTTVILITRHLVKARMKRQMQRLQQEHALETERLRIARNLHDDLGARLTQISLMSSVAVDNGRSGGESKDRFLKISHMTRGLVSALYETVWTVDPKNDHLDALINYLSRIVSDLCEPTNIRCRIKQEGVIDDRPVTSEIRHNISLAVKEAVHNAIKYSRAAEINAAFSFLAPTLTISIRDNGCGFHPGRAAAGNGLNNMRRRMDSVEGHLQIESSPNHGTIVTFNISLA
jgi:signal transduction histidine kinase